MPRRNGPVHLRVGKENIGLGRRTQRGLRSQGPLADVGCGASPLGEVKRLMIQSAFSEYLDPLY